MSLATQRSWALPSADWKLSYFSGTEYFVDLNSAMMAADLGLALYLLGDLLNETVRTTVADALDVRVFQPLKRAILSGPTPSMWWYSEASNWNAVCWAGVIIAIFCALDDYDERNFLSSNAIEHSQAYISSFQDDGYASKGVGYYNYGFTNFALLRQALYEGSGGSYDAFEHPKVSKSALFGLEYGMSSGNAANFGDSHFDNYFDKSLKRVIDSSFQVSLQDFLFDTNDSGNQPQSERDWIWVKKTSLTPSYYDEDPFENHTILDEYRWEDTFELAMMDLDGTESRAYKRKDSLNLPWYLLQLFQDSIPSVRTTSTRGMNDLRRYYNDSGVLVSRPNAANDGQGLAATFKLGGNLGAHSHNDIGSYIISVNSVQLTGDPGGPLYYDANTFNNQRYESPLMNSYGHPVPLVNGKLQKRAVNVLRKTKKPTVMSYQFTDSMDEIAFDMTRAYDEPYLEKLTREQTFDRVAQRIVITDRVVFSRPCVFEDALVTNSDWKFTGSNNGYFYDSSSKTFLYVEISSSTPFDWNVTNLSSYGVDFKRIGIYFLEPVTSADITFTFFTA